MTSNPLRTTVQDALAWAPTVDARQIGVAVTDGVVTLSGHVPSYFARVEAERVTKRVFGVKALANDLDVDLPGDSHRTDTEVAAAASSALQGRITVPRDAVTVTVNNGWVMLEGRVDWQYQRESALTAVQHLAGVKGVDNAITVKPAVDPAVVRAGIEAALMRDARLDAGKITVETTGHTVSLRGSVDSWSDRLDAQDAAWAAPGVWSVDDHLVVTS